MTASARPLRISIAQGAFLPVPPLLGGAVEKAWYALGREFAGQGHTVTHVSRSFHGLPDDETDAGVRYRRVRGHDAPESLTRLKILDFLYSRRVRRVLPEADILVTNTFWLPVLEQRRNRGVIYVHVARYPKGQLRFYPRRAVLQTVSEPISRAIIDETGRPSPRVRLVPYPLSPGYLVDMPSAKSRVLLYAGRIHPEKGVHVLIRAFAALCERGCSGWKLRIVGPWETRQGGGGDAYLQELKKLAGENEITFVGPLFGERELVAEYSDASVFVYPSLAEKGETFGLAVLEAMAAGCAPIVSRLPCFGDFINDGQNGVSFDHHGPEAVDALAATLGSLLPDADRLAALQSAAWGTARAYALPLVAKRFIQDFQEVLQGKSATPLPVNRAGAVPI